MDSHQQSERFPLVSVIVPAYNAEALIERTLSCVLSQTYKNLEVLVIDDGSTDRTAEIIKLIAQQDPRVILLQQQNAGVAAARNLGIQSAKGEFIAPLDADDLWYPENLEKRVKCLFQADASVGLVYAWSVDIDEEDSPTGEFRASTIEGKVYTPLICHNFLGNASASLIRRACIDQVGGYNCQLKEQNAQGCEDWDFYLRIAEHYQFRVVPEFLIGYRKIAGSMSRDYSKMARSHALMLQGVRQKHPEISSTLYRFSKSSFYMYLARQSSQYNSYQSTLVWLYKALQEDLITPFLRPGLYALSIKSILGIVTRPVSSRIKLEHDFFSLFKGWFSSEQRVITLADIEKRRMEIYFKLLAEQILHRALMITSIFRAWKNQNRRKSADASPIHEG